MLKITTVTVNAIELNNQLRQALIKLNLYQALRIMQPLNMYGKRSGACFTKPS